MRFALQTEGWQALNARLARLLALLLVLTALAPYACAQLMVQLDTASKTGNAGTTLTFSGKLSNTGLSDLFLNGFDYDFGSVSPFFIGDIAPSVPRGLAPSSSSTGNLFPGSSYTGDIFVVQIDATTPPGVYPVGVTISGGDDDQASNPLASIFFQVVVEELPEPTALTLFAVGALVFYSAKVCLRR